MVKAWRIIVAAIVFMIISEVIQNIEAMLTMSYYTNPDYFAVWSKIMMPGPGAPPITFYYYSIVFAFIGGLIFAGVYAVIANGVPGKTLLKKGVNYGLLIWLIGSIPGYLALILLINLPIDLIAYWTVTGLIINILAGAAIVRIVK